MILHALIPARGGSKGIPGKNLTPCAGQPLLYYSAKSALASKLVSKTFLSTDSKSIADYGSSLGLEVPFLRPSELADDESPVVETVSHFYKWLENSGQVCDGIVLLQPTSPLRSSFHIDGAIELFQKQMCTVVTICMVPHKYSPSSLMIKHGNELASIGDLKLPQLRQNKEKLWARNGPSVLIIKPDDLSRGTLYGDKIVGYEMPYLTSVDIDGMDDLKIAESLIQSGHYD